MSNIRQAIEYLLDYRQADEEGIMVLASRQAIEEVVAALNDTLHARAQAEARAEEAERLIREGVEWMEAVLSAFAKNGIGEDRGEEHLSQQIAEHRAFLARNTPEERK